tara:strand:+ start:1240 stop:1596 length:357 start_codon:yes stop_codon:yes gene_type:complete
MTEKEYDVSKGAKVYELAHALAEYWPTKKWKVSKNEITWLDTSASPTKEEVQAKVDEMNAAEPLRHLRAQRNLKLEETDWWAVADRTMTDAEKAYRQALRDLPANTSDPSNPTFPTKP